MADTIELMKQRVLDMAVRGELVKQHIEEGTAQELISQIKKEKETLLSNSDIKKQDNLPDINAKELPFDIPQSWEWVRMGTVINEIFGGGTPSKTNMVYWNGDIPWASVKDISETDMYLTTTIDSITEEGLENSSAKIVNPGDIVVITRMGLGRIVISKITTAINQDLKGIKLTSQILSKYFLYAYKTLSIEGTGTTVKGITQKALLNTFLPIPPIKEQKRIVSKIEDVFSIIDKIAERKEDALQTIQLIRQTTLQQAIQGKLVEQNGQDEPAIKLLDEIEKEKPTLINKMGVRKPRKTSEVTEDEVLFNIPNSWIWTRLSELGLVIGGGTPKTSVEEYWEKGTISWITPADLSNYNEMYISEGNRKITDLGLEKSSAKLMPSGSVLYSSRAPIGYIAIASNPIATNQGFKSIVPYVMDTNKYIYYHLQAFTDDIESRSSGTTFKEISGTEFGKTLVPLPPLSEQKRIVEKIEHIMELCDQMEELFK